MNDLITCFQEILQKQVVNKNNFNTVLGGPNIYTEEHGHPMLRKRHMAFTITEFERDAWLENMQTAINRAAFPQGVGDYLFERLRLTANHMVNS